MASSEAIHVSTRPFPARRPRRWSCNPCTHYSNRMIGDAPLIASLRSQLPENPPRKDGELRTRQKLRLRFEPIQR
jgi:hypothetical protein